MDTPKEDKRFYASPRQREVLLRLITHPTIEQSFFLTGGTALAVFYLHHRVSDDLDLFTLTSANLSELDFWIRNQWTDACSKIKEGPNFLSFLINETKVEFVRDPLSNNESRAAIGFDNGGHLLVDNLRNIYSNKLCAMVSRQEPKDFVDFYFMTKRFPSLDLEAAFQEAKRKDAIFDDPPTAAFQLEEGLALIRDNPNLLPKTKVEFDLRQLLDDFAKLAEWVYRKYKP